MHKNIKIIRWILVIPAAVIAWYLALVISLFLLNLVEIYCPQEFTVSGACSASWTKAIFNVLVIFGAGLASILILVFSALMAPSKKILVSKVVFMGGVLFAIYAVHQTSAWGAFISAILCGTVTLIIQLRVLKRMSFA